MFEKFEKGTEVLSAEHRVIERGLDILEKMMGEFEAEGKIVMKDLSDLIDFVRHFADACHHAKEEKLLFPALGQKGMPANSGPVAVMLQEHDSGRQFVRGIANGIEKFKTQPAGAKAQIIQNATGYISLLRQHIFKEDNILFPMADSMMDSDEQKKMIADFERTEKEEIGSGVHERYHEMIEELEKKYS